MLGAARVERLLAVTLVSTVLRPVDLEDTDMARYSMPNRPDRVVCPKWKVESGYAAWCANDDGVGVGGREKDGRGGSAYPWQVELLINVACLLDESAERAFGSVVLGPCWGADMR